MGGGSHEQRVDTVGPLGRGGPTASAAMVKPSTTSSRSQGETVSVPARCRLLKNTALESTLPNNTELQSAELQSTQQRKNTALQSTLTQQGRAHYNTRTQRCRALLHKRTQPTKSRSDGLCSPSCWTMSHTAALNAHTHIHTHTHTHTHSLTHAHSYRHLQHVTTSTQTQPRTNRARTHARTHYDTLRGGQALNSKSWAQETPCSSCVVSSVFC